MNTKRMYLIALAVLLLTMIVSPTFGAYWKRIRAINCGGSAVDYFESDNSYSGGGTYETTASIYGPIGSTPTYVYQTERNNNGMLIYTINGLHPNGTYRVSLHFAEIYWDSADKRKFNVYINGSLKLQNYDIFTEAGGKNRATWEVFQDINADSSGKIFIQFNKVKDFTKCSGIEIHEVTVQFNDYALKAEVESELGITDPTPSQMLDLTWFAPAIDTTDLTGLEYATNLQELYLWQASHISDLSPLSGLTNLKKIDLSSNQISNITPLSGLINLERLVLQINQISDISALSSLTNLTYFDILDNQISNISALSGLTNLETLHLRGNQIADLSALLGMSKLTFLTLQENPLNQQAYCTHLNSIAASNSGIALRYDPSPYQPTGVSATDGTYPDKVRVTWDAYCNGPEYDSYYKIHRSTSAMGLRLDISGWETSTTFDDNAVDPGTTYYYWIQVATDTSGSNSQFSGYDTGYAGTEDNQQACCFPDGSCADLDPTVCQQQGGVPQGPGTDCATTTCPTCPDSSSWMPDSATVIPTSPTSTDFISIHLSGEWHNSCIPNTFAVSQTDNTITINMDKDYPPGWICLQGFTPWERSVPVGSLASGTYTVYISYKQCGPEYITEFDVTETVGLDFGDAPEQTYPTLLSSDGARHTIAYDVRLGSILDSEPDGQPDADALGDDLNNRDDEDGVVFASAVVPDTSASVQVSALCMGYLSAWLDFNGDGDWDDTDEQIFDNKILTSGTNNLVFNVPVNAAKGQTFARFRFSTYTIPAYTGLVDNGEVEDYKVRIGEPYEIISPFNRLNWSQPPLEIDPLATDPVYCGWDEPSYVYGYPSLIPSNWTIVADDFFPLGNMPITSVHWWGSYVGWSQDVPPQTKPTGFKIAFWSDIGGPVSHPYMMMRHITVAADRLHEERAGSDEFPGIPADTCFQYYVDLDPEEIINAVGDVMWISISAIYDSSNEPEYPWGWKSRPRHWMNDAVVFNLWSNAFELGPFILSSEEDITPIEGVIGCNRTESFDMAFELDTDPNFVKWAQPFTHLRHWSHYEDELSMATAGTYQLTQPPDLIGTGLDVDATEDFPPTGPMQVLADDFVSTVSGPLIGIEIWGSWLRDILPSGGATNVSLEVSIHGDTLSGEPGTVLWTHIFTSDEFSVESIDAEPEGYFRASDNAYSTYDHSKVYKYTLQIESDEAFVTSGSELNPVTYWLSVQAHVVHAPGSMSTRFGWKTSIDRWNEAAVWGEGWAPYSGDWEQLNYPIFHALMFEPIDLAFTVAIKSGASEPLIQRRVYDDWQCQARTPVTAAVWWGSYIGYKYQSCQCETATPPKKPDYFLLSIWSDVPDPTPNDPGTFSTPGQKLWEYKASDFEEVLVGFDKYPYEECTEPVFRYSVRLPQGEWFYQDAVDGIYWFSVMAVFEDLESMVYPWGWTNHEHVFNDDAVEGQEQQSPAGVGWQLQPITDQTGEGADMSFMLFTEPN